MRKALILIGLVGGLLAAAPASAAIREVPQDFPTIQDAVDAANPGDTIEVSKKRNNEGVNVATNNLLIKGVKPGVIVDSYINASGDDYQFDISANNVRIVNLGLRNGYGITCSGDGCTAKKLRYSGENNSECFEAVGDRAKVIRSTLINCGGLGVDISGDDAKVKRNTVRRTDTGCIYVGGDDAEVVGNKGGGCEDADAIEVTGDRALVQDNSFRSTDSYGVYVTGVGPRVLGNRIANSSSDCFYVDGDRAKVRGNVGNFCGSYGFEVYGDDQKVTGNRTSVPDGYGLYVSCSIDCNDMEVSENVVDGTVEDDTGIYVTVSDGGLLITGNVVRDATDYGLDLEGVDDSRIADNVVNGAGSEEESGFYLSGESNQFSGNKALNGGGEGWEIYGDGNVLEDNLARGNSVDGFYLGSGYEDIVMLRNRALGNGGDGFQNEATDTILRKNRASGNHRDCANGGTIAVKQGNKCADGSNFNLPGTVSRARP